MTKVKFPNITSAVLFEITKQADAKTSPFNLLSTFNWANNSPVDDPGPTQWQTVGLIESMGADFPLIQQDRISFAVRFNDRTLPAAVRDEALLRKVADIKQREGRNVSKKEYRELRDEVEQELLPRAFIRRSTVMFTFLRNGTLIIWTSSARKCDQVVEVVMALFERLGQVVSIAYYEGDTDIDGLLYNIAFNSSEAFGAGSAGVYYHDGGDAADPVVRLRNVESEGERLSLLKQGYKPREVEISSAEGDIICTVNQAFMFKKIDVLDAGKNDNGDTDDKVNAFTSSLFITSKVLVKTADSLLAEAPGADEEDDDL
jgi:DNA recombination-dependent growth factor C